MKRIRGAMILCCLGGALGCLAQDARSLAMGGITILNDFNHVIYNPSSLNDFPDQFMGTAGTYHDTLYAGPVVAKKSFGRVLNLGVIANTTGTQGSSVLRGNFYPQARSFLLVETGDTLPAAFPMIPHGLLGLNFGDFGLGVDAYYETVYYGRTGPGDGQYSHAGIDNTGLCFSANIYLGDFWLCPLLGFGKPVIRGERKDSALTTVSSKKGDFFTAGTEAGIELSKAMYVAGVYYTNERSQFSSTRVLSPDYATVIFDIYAGYTIQLPESTLLAIQYDLTLQNDDSNDTNKVAPLTYQSTYAYHAFHLGVEKTFTTTGMFDAVIPRAGLLYAVEKSTETTNAETEWFPLFPYAVQLNSGIGLKKDIFDLDLFFNIGTWSGLISGPRSLAATLTVRLPKKKEATDDSSYH